MIQRGILDRVTSTPLGTKLDADAPATSTTLVVDWTVEFNEAGGWLSLNSIMLAYTSVDEDASTITLAEPLTLAALADDQVLSLSDAGGERSRLEAFVAIDAGVQSVPHDIHSSLEGRITERTPPGTPVLVDTATRTIVGLDNISAPLDGSTIDPTTLPAGNPTDGLVPSSSPTPTVYGGVKSLLVLIPPVANSDPVTVDVFAATTSPVPTTGTPVASVVASFSGPSLVTIRKVAGADVVPGATYYVVTLARDDDGPASSASTAASGTPAQVNTADIAVGAVTADMLIANNALITALGVVDLSTTNLTSVNIDGGSIAVATSQDGVFNEQFSGTAFPPGWSSTKTNYDGTGTGPAAVPGASVVATGAPTGVSGSALLIDYGPAGVEGNWAGGKIGTTVISTQDAQIEIRFRRLVNSGGFSSDRFGLVLREQGVANGDTEDAIYLDLRGDYSIDTASFPIYSRVNGSDATLATIQSVSNTSAAWHIAKLRVLAGQVQAKVWQDGTPEPDWTTVQQAGVLTPGEAALTWRQFTVGNTTTGQKVWVDYVNVTTYSTGFAVNPDGTGSWPAIETPLRGRLSALEAPLLVILTSSTVQTVADAARTTLLFNTVQRVTGTWASTATGVTVPADGVYQVNAHAMWSSATTGRRYLEVCRGATIVARSEFVVSVASTPSNAVSTDVVCAAGDVISLAVYQSSGASLGTSTGTPARLTVRRVST